MPSKRRIYKIDGSIKKVNVMALPGVKILEINEVF